MKPHSATKRQILSYSKNLSTLPLHTNNLIRRLKRIKRPSLLPPIAHTRIILLINLASLRPAQRAPLAIVNNAQRNVVAGPERAAAVAALFDLLARAHFGQGSVRVVGFRAHAPDVPDFEPVVPDGCGGAVEGGAEGEEGEEGGGELHL
jgi:hypothetical protein